MVLVEAPCDEVVDPRELVIAGLRVGAVRRAR